MIAHVVIRPFRAGDAERVCEIYYRSVHEVARAKYDAAQVRAWAPAIPAAALWLDRLSSFQTFVAERASGEVVAWIAMTDAGYIDMFFCLPEAAGCGVGAQLYAAVERTARAGGLARLSAHASLLAESFFLKHGWTVDERETVVRAGVELPRAVMSKTLPALVLVDAGDADFAWLIADGEPPRNGLRIAPGGLDDDPATIAHVRTIAARMRAENRRGSWMMAAGGEIVGLIGYHGPPSIEGEVEIGYNVAPTRRRLGYATAAVAGLVAIAQADPAIVTIVAHTEPENRGSQRALVRNGFERVICPAAPGGDVRWRRRLRP